MKLKKIAGALSIAGIAVAGMLLTAPAASAASCGYWTTHDAKYFTNCSTHSQKIQVDYVIGSTQSCAAPGTTTLYDGWNNPVTNAFVVAESC
ncbi:DUF6355 family natural product biosynthesis protein [Microbacterium sp. NPDC056052]|uniref:DUF6355 family natural product biosynthesis protein n=1 Tax=Microbacterium sp. NPDC056052 TaxID=3345695 RepID=UPI0035D59B66